MARSFNGTSSRVYATAANVIPTAPQFTMACWFKPTNATSYGVLMSLNRTGNSLHSHCLSALGDQTGDPVEASSSDTAVSGAWSAGFTAGTWNHACGVWTSTTNRAAFCNGTAKNTNTTSRNPTSLGESNIGAWRGSSGFGGTYFNGQIALPAIWNIALSDAEVASLAAGAMPDQVRPQNLISYQLFDPRILDAVAGNLWTNTGSTDSNDHPPLR